VREHATKWDRHAILAEIKRRYGTLAAFARKTPVSASDISVALGSPYPKAEAAIAKALGIPAAALWPDRYWPDGRRRPVVTRVVPADASQKLHAGADREAAP
jgi:Ner family transcriptional regulator